jgi:hypothetical protein
MERRRIRHIDSQSDWPLILDIGQMTEQKQSDGGEITGLRGDPYIVQDKAK